MGTEIHSPNLASKFAGRRGGEGALAVGVIAADAFVGGCFGGGDAVLRFAFGGGIASQSLSSSASDGLSLGSLG